MCNCMEPRNPFASIAEKIPDSEKPALIQAVNNTYRVLTPAWEDMELLFRIWNTYVSPGEPQDIGCGGCRTRGVGKLRNVVKMWTDGD